jgi:hypothetical protein
MFNLPSACQLYDSAINLESKISQLINYKSIKAQIKAQAQQNNQSFDENAFNESYGKKTGIDPKTLSNFQNHCSHYFSECAQGLGIHNLANIKSSISSYSKYLKKSEETVNYMGFKKEKDSNGNEKVIFDLTLDSLLSNDDDKFTNTILMVKKMKEDAKIALKDSEKKHSKNYDNLTIKDFKEKGDSEEAAMQKYAAHISSVFLTSKQSQKENKKEALKIKKSLNKTMNKIALYENKKLKLNIEAANRLYDLNYSISQVDDILGKNYINKKRWEDNLANLFATVLQNVINPYLIEPKKAANAQNNAVPAMA